MTIFKEHVTSNNYHIELLGIMRMDLMKKDKVKHRGTTKRVGRVSIQYLEISHDVRKEIISATRVCQLCCDSYCKLL